MRARRSHSPAVPQSHRSVISLALAILIASLPRRESTDFFLPLVAKHQDHHLLIDVRVVAQASYRASALRRENFVGGLSLLCERRQRSDVPWRWLRAMYFDPEFALVAFMLLCLDLDATQRSVVASEVPDESNQRREVILFGR